MIGVLRMDAFEAYKTYLALKSHFTTKSYDFFKYNGAVRASKKSFDTRHDKYFFHKLSKKKDIVNYLVANFMYDDPNKWVGDLLNNARSDEQYLKFVKIRDSMTHIVSTDLSRLLDNFDDNLKVVDGQHPHLLKLVLRGEVHVETLIILNDLCSFTKMWNRKIEDTIIWPELFLKCKKYRPFITYDKEKIRQIVIDKFS